MDSISGSFEVHLIVDATQEHDLMVFVKDFQQQGDAQRLVRPRVTVAQSLYGACPRQPMLTFRMSGRFPAVREYVYALTGTMKQNGFLVRRIKIEAALHNNGVAELWASPPQEIKDKNYIEFHCKVPVSGAEQWNKLADVCVNHGAPLFYNPVSKNGFMEPIVTLRRYGITPIEAEIELTDLLKDLKSELGISEVQNLEKEFSCYDSAVELDKDWIYTGNQPDQFLHKVPVPMKVPVFAV